jgi:hypothetical protein
LATLGGERLLLLGQLFALLGQFLAFAGELIELLVEPLALGLALLQRLGLLLALLAQLLELLGLLFPRLLELGELFLDLLFTFFRLALFGLLLALNLLHGGLDLGLVHGDRLDRAASGVGRGRGGVAHTDAEDHERADRGVADDGDNQGLGIARQ